MSRSAHRNLYCTWYAAVAVPNKKPSGKLARLSLVEDGHTGPSAFAGEATMVRSKSSPMRGSFCKAIFVCNFLIFFKIKCLGWFFHISKAFFL